MNEQSKIKMSNNNLNKIQQFEIKRNVVHTLK